jgi:hypothetical protein
MINLILSPQVIYLLNVDNIYTIPIKATKSINHIKYNQLI